MAGKRHTSAEIAEKLHEADELVARGKTQAEISRVLGISVMTYHRWKKLRASTASAAPGWVERGTAGHPAAESEARRLFELQLENTRLRRLVTDLLLEKVKLEEQLYSRNGPPSGRRNQA